jgi:5-methyltetrahydrofolate--homocysteine methyltransferase
MTDTIISSATREVVIGFDRPFVMIGERINPTGRKILAAEMAAGDFSRVEADARAQVAAGAHMLDVNAGIPLADEPAILAKAVQLVQSVTDVPLSIDSSIVAALEAGLAVYKDTARRWWRSPTTRRASPRIRTYVSRWLRRSCTARRITASRPPMWWSIRS